MKLRSPHRQGGFTLMEIMLVVAIIAILAGMLIYKNADVLETGSDVAAKANLANLRTSLITYRMYAGIYPTTEQGLKALVTKPESEPRPLSWKKVFDEIPRDPWGREFLYANPGVKHPDSYDLYSAGKDGKPNTEDDVWQN
jgi:general secretion pathway protein G